MDDVDVSRPQFGVHSSSIFPTMPTTLTTSLIVLGLTCFKCVLGWDRGAVTAMAERGQFWVKRYEQK